MSLILKTLGFVCASVGIAWISRSSLRNPEHHGFYRFFAWEAILLLFLVNVDHWFRDPFSAVHLASWVFLVVSLVLIYLGVRSLRRLGDLDEGRDDPGLVGIEKTTTLVKTGIYANIRHPFYSSLLFLGWGILLKRISWASIILAGIAITLLVLTARKEEVENVAFFGEDYRDYMAETKMFIPFLF